MKMIIRWWRGYKTRGLSISILKLLPFSFFCFYFLRFLSIFWVDFILLLLGKSNVIMAGPLLPLSTFLIDPDDEYDDINDRCDTTIWMKRIFFATCIIRKSLHFDELPCLRLYSLSLRCDVMRDEPPAVNGIFNPFSHKCWEIMGPMPITESTISASCCRATLLRLSFSFNSNSFWKV